MPFSTKLARYARRVLLPVAILAMLLVGYVVVENWRGERAWRVYCAQRAAAGDPVDVFPAPSSLLGERNFMKTPVLDRLLFASDGSVELAEFEKSVSGLANPSGDFLPWRSGGMIDLPSIAIGVIDAESTAKAQTRYRAAAEAILAAHAQSATAAALDELRSAALTRADSQIVHPVAISEQSLLDFPLPRFPVVRDLARTLVVDACASLAAGHSEQAWRDAMAVAQLTRGFAKTPDTTLVETMVVGALGNLLVQPLWEARVRGQWSDLQWSQVQQILAEIGPSDSLRRCFGIGRVHAAGLLHNTPVRTLLSDKMQRDEPLPPWAVVLYVIPGWVQWNKISAVEDMDARLGLIAKHGTPEFLPALRQDRARRNGSRGKVTPGTVLAPAYAPSYERVIDLVLVAETNIALARTVCAVERYRLAHGGYPDSLHELVPAYMDAVPRDVIDGQPLRYRKEGSDSFVLYSIGLDGNDDGGALADWRSDEWIRQGDWCWPQPAQ